MKHTLTLKRLDYPRFTRLGKRFTFVKLVIIHVLFVWEIPSQVNLYLNSHVIIYSTRVVLSLGLKSLQSVQTADMILLKPKNDELVEVLSLL